MAERILVLEDQVIYSLLRNPAIVAEFPFMRGVAAKTKPAGAAKAGGCGSCGKKKRLNTGDYAGIRAAIANMSQEKKLRLLQILGVDKIRVYYVNDMQQKVKVELSRA